MIFFNSLGLAWLVAGIGAAFGLRAIHVIPDGNLRAFFGVMALVIVSLDVAYRFFLSRKKYATAVVASPELRKNVLKHWTLGAAFGGDLMFLPAWICAPLVWAWLSYLVLA